MIDAPNKFCKLTEIEKNEIIKIKRTPSLIRAQSKYYQKNKAKITKMQTEYNKIYNKQTFICECGDTITNAGKWHHLKSKRHTRRLENIKLGKTPSALKSEEIVDCVCGGHYKFRNRQQHLRTKKHKTYLHDSQSTLRTQLNDMVGNTVPMSINNKILLKEI